MSRILNVSERKRRWNRKLSNRKGVFLFQGGERAMTEIKLVDSAIRAPFKSISISHFEITYIVHLDISFISSCRLRKKELWESA